jgi:hypothetical protein
MKRRRGAAIMLAISAIFILLFVGLILVFLAKRQVFLTSALKQRKEAFSKAEKGIAEMMYVFKYGKRRHDVMRAPGGGVLTTSRGDPIFHRIRDDDYETTVWWTRYVYPKPGYQVGPKGVESFAGFYYHGTSTGRSKDTERIIHFTVERVYRKEY